MASSNWPYHITFEMKKLERELSASNAEAARLREQLASAFEIAQEFRAFKALHYQCSCDMCKKLASLKAEIK
jgi:hypothetical protein